MVGSPGQTPEYLAEDMLFLERLKPHMVGIGPFIPHHGHPICRPVSRNAGGNFIFSGTDPSPAAKVLLPATTALGTIAPDGREQGILAGANVIMPNLSPRTCGKATPLYDNKLCTGAEAAEARKELEERMAAIGYQVVTTRGDSLM